MLQPLMGDAVFARQHHPCLLLSILVLLTCPLSISASDEVVDLSQKWKLSPLYNKNQAYCNIQSVMAPVLLEGYVIVQDGMLIAEGYNKGRDKNDLFVAYSATKSFSTMLIGKMVELRQVSIDETLGDIFDQFSDWMGVEQQEEKKSVTLKSLLTMTSGLLEGSDEFRDQVDLQQVLNFLEYNEDEKGKFNYLGASHILSRIILRRSGLTPRQFVQANGIFDRIGITESDYKWETFGGVEGTAFGLITHPRAMAKLGQLYLQKGLAAQGDQLIQADWVEASVTNQLQDDTTTVQCLMLGYGYQWYADREERDGDLVPIPAMEGAFAANGILGQQILVIPGTNTVIAIMARDYTCIYNYAFSIIVLENLPVLQDKAEDDENCGRFSVSSFVVQSSAAFALGILQILANLILE